jgi:ABC-type branched-subunit amino acid transport system ATPase component
LQEPTVILERFKVFDLLRRQTSIVIVEHNLDLVLALADRVFALERGTVFHHGPAAPLLTDSVGWQSQRVARMRARWRAHRLLTNAAFA